MPLISVSFLILFLPISLAFHFFAARFGDRVRLCALIAISFVFYAAWDVRAMALLAGSIAVNYAVGRLLEQALRDADTARPNLLLALGVAFNIGVLGVFRYADFFIHGFDTLSGADYAAGKILVPLGVLFFSCDQIAYLADLRHGKRYEPDLLRYAAFVSFFPRLLAGPLLRYGEIAPQWRGQKPNAEDLAIGLTTFLIGLAKIVLLADAVAPYAAQVFSAANTGRQIEFFSAWTGIIAFACQIYFDLSGYADMAIGLGRCFGLRLPENFRSPYRAANIADFWRRWNITLAAFLRDYVYLPLGGNRGGTLRASANLVAAMVLGGLWYGAGWMFVAWGLLHTFYVLVHRAWRAFLARRGTRVRAPGTARVLGILVTFIAVTFGWVIFRAADATVAFDLIVALFGGNGAVLPADYAALPGPILSLAHKLGIVFAYGGGDMLAKAWAAIALCLVVIFALPTTATFLSSTRAMPADPDAESPPQLLPPRWRPSPFWSVALGALAFACLASAYGINDLLHWRF